MGYTTSTVHGIEVPDSAEANNVPEDIGKVVTALEAGSIVKRLTGAQIAALTAPQKPAGLLVFNTTTGRYQMSNGSTFVDLVDSHIFAQGVRTSNQTIPYTETTVTYTAETDSSSMLNTGTGVLTVPVAGLWLFSAYAVEAVGNYFQSASIRSVSGAALVAHQPYSFTTYNLSALYLASASETFDFRIAGGASTNVSSARFAAVCLNRT
jgi:hypothetical protein